MSAPKPPVSRLEAEAIAVSRDPVLAHMLAEEKVEVEGRDVQLLKRLLGYLRPHRLLATLCVLMAVAEALAMTIPPYIVGLAMDRASGVTGRTPRMFDHLLDAIGEVALSAFDRTTADTAALVTYFGVMSLLFWMIRFGVAVTTSYWVQKLSQLILHDLRVDIFAHITSMDMGFFHKNPVGRLVNRTTFDVASLSELFSDAFAQGMRDILFVLVLYGVMFSIDVKLASLLLLVVPALVLISRGYQRMVRPALRANSAVVSRMNGWLAENLAGMRENQLYRREMRRAAEYKALTDAHQTAQVGMVRPWAWVRPAMMLTSSVATAAILWLGYQRVSTGIITVGVLLTFIQYTSRLWVPIRNLTEKFNLVQQSLTSGERIMEILDERSGMTDGPGAASVPAPQRGEVRFEEVRFRYSGREEEVLKGITFAAEAGQMVALVGDTGAGKSTVAHLISRFYDVSGGSVQLDGRDVRSYPLAALRSSIAIVPQDVVVFAGTVRDNITLGRPVDDAAVWRCVEAVSARAIVERLGGLDGQLDEGGRTLSTGERQLLSFARALVGNPPVLILDEATANVDTRTEMVIAEALRNLTRGRTTIAIAHRLSTIREADEILVLGQGEVVERGRHEALLASDGVYAKLYRTHLAGSGSDS